jgi:hypothetical protein
MPFKFLLISFLLVLLPVTSQSTLADNHIPVSGTAGKFVELIIMPPELMGDPLREISENWTDGYTPMLIEILSLSGTERAYYLLELLEDKTGQNFGRDTNQWFSWWWQQEQVQVADYAAFKSSLYGLIDEKFLLYFSTSRESRIRLDEVRWGGVIQDGIPPLRQPRMLAADEASYLEDDNIVFGIEINGDARAYPKRILAWHEMFVDDIGGIDFAGVYCTLCGAVILYKTNHNGTRHDLGTSGFLYRSNKLMYDKATQSLWNTTWGEPVIGPLVDQDIRLERSYLVTTTWGEWKRRHPDSKVLSLDTGYSRNYDEGVAYRQYFATDELMFSISTSDDRLNNKDEILALTFPQFSKDTMAISARFLQNRPIYVNRLGSVEFVVLTDTSGANRVYEAENHSFTSYDQDVTLIDSKGMKWNLSEDELRSGDLVLARLPAHRAFWFGWHSAFPDTTLVR